MPYLDTGVPLDALGGRLFRLSDGPAGVDCHVRAAALLGVAATALDARVVQHAAWSWLQRAAAD
ncbi:hypothetical protein [Piscinibacter sp.]|uniref:hypothetical protein n=1 Tax=Piscinibacter sp. TaxID=1903157 RepID=UPI002F429A75